MNTLYNMSVKLSLEASAFSSGLRLAVNALGNFVKNAAAAQGKTAELNTALKQIGTGAVVTGVGVLLAKGLGDAASKGADLQVVMKQIGMATGASAKQMDAFGKSFANIGTHNQMSNVDAARVALAEIHAGITDPNRVKATIGTIANYSEVQQLSNHTSRESAATTAAEFAHAFGAYTPELLNPLVNDLSKALTHAPTTGAGFLRLISQFSGATRNIYGGTQADHLRMQHDDIMMGALLAQMGQGTRGGTQFSSALMHMVSTKAGHQGAAELDRLGGGTFFNKDGTFKGNENFLKILSTAAKRDNNPIVMDNIMKNAFGLTGLRLMGMLSDPNSLKQYINNETTFARVPDIGTQQSVLNATNAGQIQQLHKNIETLVTMLGTTLLPTLVSITSAFVGITKAAIEFANANPAVMQVVGVLALAVTGFALVAGPILMVIGAFGLLEIALGAVGLTIAAVLWPVTLVVAGIAAVVLIVTHWNEITKAFGDTVQAVISPIRDLLILLHLIPGSIPHNTAADAAARAAAHTYNTDQAKHHAGAVAPTYVMPGDSTNTMGGVPIKLHKSFVPNVPNKQTHGHGGGGGPGDVIIQNYNENHFHINGADHATTERLAQVVAKHVNAIQGKTVQHIANNGALSHRGLVPRYQ